MTESQLQAEILRVYGSRPWLRLFRRNVGLAVNARGIPVRFGVKGQCDLWGFTQAAIAGCSRHVEIEVKSPTGRLTKEQQAWGATCERFGCIYVLARSVEDVRQRFAEAGYV